MKKYSQFPLATFCLLSSFVFLLASCAPKGPATLTVMTHDSFAISEDVVKAFRTLPPVHSQLTPETWRLSCPSSGTMEPLVVTFPAALDHALLHRFLTVRQSDRDVAGKATTDSGETVWRFVPRNPWRASAGQLIVNSLLEDLAGNSLARPFEIDLDSPPPAKVPDLVILGWQPKPLR